MKSTGSPFRIRLISGSIIVVALVFIVRLYFLQVVYGDNFGAEAERQYVNTNTVAYDRSNIYFTSKTGENTLAAMTRSGFTVAVHPDLIKDPEETYRLLSSLIDIDKNDFLEKAAKKGDPYEEVAYKINEETANKIKALKIPGVLLSVQKWRYYPLEASAAQVLGFVSFNSEDKLIGSYGLDK